MKILIVEDEPTSLKLAHLVLSSGGYEVTQAEAAAKAMEEILRSAPEIILLDLELPDVMGLTLARQLKADPQTSHITIIAITGFQERYSRADALEAGCDGYIIKPIDTRRLSQQVAELVDQTE
jgi:two-component system cell cycle response regulator DivK